MAKVMNRRVLVLNKNYEPLSTMSVETAIKKLSKDDTKLEVVEWDKTRFIYSTKEKFKVPVIIRLTYYLDLFKKREKSGSKRFAIYRRDKYTCSYCSMKVKPAESGKLTLDHVFPRSRGGRNTPDNLVTCCYKCNHKKGNRTPDEAGMRLLISSSLLKVRLDTVRMSSYVEHYPEWSDYLMLTGQGHIALMAKD